MTRMEEDFQKGNEVVAQLEEKLAVSESVTSKLRSEVQGLTLREVLHGAALSRVRDRLGHGGVDVQLRPAVDLALRGGLEPAELVRDGVEHARRHERTRLHRAVQAALGGGAAAARLALARPSLA